MPISFECSDCGTTLRVKEQYGGRRIKCPHCDAVNRVPAEEEESDDDDDGEVIVAFDGEEPIASAAKPDDSSVIREFRKRNREMAAELARLKAAQEAAPLVLQDEVVGPVPTLEECDWDENKLAQAIEARVRGLQHRLAAELRIPVSFGIATNKLVSQIASKLRKPRGFVVVPPGTEAAFLAPLSIGKLPGIGAKTEAALNARGLRLIGEIAGKTDRELESLFGDSWREMRATARGEDERAVHTDHEDAKSYSQQETFFADVADFAEIERVAKRMVDELLPKVREDKKRVRTMTVKVRYPDFTQETHGRSLADATDLEAPFYPLVAPLLREAWTKNRPLRLVSVRFSNVEDGGQQLEMFAETDEKRRRLAGVLDKLNSRGRSAVVQHGHQLGAKKE